MNALSPYINSFLDYTSSSTLAHCVKDYASAQCQKQWPTIAVIFLVSGLGIAVIKSLYGRVQSIKASEPIVELKTKQELFEETKAEILKRVRYHIRNGVEKAAIQNTMTAVEKVLNLLQQKENRVNKLEDLQLAYGANIHGLDSSKKTTKKIAQKVISDFCSDLKETKDLLKRAISSNVQTNDQSALAMQTSMQIAIIEKNKTAYDRVVQDIFKWLKVKKVGDALKSLQLATIPFVDMNDELQSARCGVVLTTKGVLPITAESARDLFPILYM